MTLVEDFMRLTDGNPGGIRFSCSIDLVSVSQINQFHIHV